MADHGPGSYWEQTQRPLASLFMALPAIAIYELLVGWLGGPNGQFHRTEADLWLRSALAFAGLGQEWFPPILVLSILLTWHLLTRQHVRLSVAFIAVMVLESAGWAIALMGLSRLIDWVFFYLDNHPSMVMTVTSVAGNSHLAPLVGYLGAGIYEEFLFRLALIPPLFAALRLLQMPDILSSSLAITASSLLFATAHHAGSPAESFTWFAFIFRWMAGVIFAWIFILRGFGIAVATHAIYDILVEWLG